VRCPALVDGDVIMLCTDGLTDLAARRREKVSAPPFNLVLQISMR
jgi:hypothetical protein